VHGDVNSPRITGKDGVAGSIPAGGSTTNQQLRPGPAPGLFHAAASRARQAEERLAVGRAWQDSGLVFTWPDGSAIHPERFSKWFEQRARAASLPKIRLHDVRHSYATAALAAGVPAKIVSERLGHANIAITMDTYSHVLPGLDAAAAGTVARLILGDAKPAVDKSLTTGPRVTDSGKEVKGERPGQKEGDRGDSNPRPSGPQPDALTN
jgi:hypothetical protein